jgi:small-conductance mechanosensitive channel
MSDSVKKFHEDYEKTIMNLYPGDIKVTMNSSLPSNQNTVPPTDLNSERVKTDKYIQALKDKFEQRSQTGIKKYGTTLERDDLNKLDWLTHLEEELMDALGYIQVLRDKLQK